MLIKRAFTLIEVLVGLFFSLSMLVLVQSILSLMLKVDLQKISQLDVFEVQLKQLLIRSNIVSCQHDLLVLDDFEIYFDRNRIVKSPGYEILLQNVTEMSWNCGRSFQFKSRGQEYEILLP